MSESEAISGMRAVLRGALASAPDTKVYIRETFDHTPPSTTVDTFEVTHHQSPRYSREYKSGLRDAGSSTHQMNYIMGSTWDVFLVKSLGKDMIWELTWPNGFQTIWKGVIESYGPDGAPVDDRMTATLSIKASGAPTQTSSPISPFTLIDPSIAASAKVGVPIIVDDGDWAGATDVTYQWQADGADIDGATSSTYVPVTDDVGAVITCDVTGANGSFQVTVSSNATTAVTAAA